MPESCHVTFRAGGQRHQKGTVQDVKEEEEEVNQEKEEEVNLEEEEESRSESGGRGGSKSGGRGRKRK